MKTTKLIALSVAATFAALSVHGQTFKNLNFEAANPVSVGDPNNPYDVTAASALTDWTVYLGTVQQTDVLQNAQTYGQASVDIFGPNFRAAGAVGSASPGTIDGNYSVFLQSGGAPPPAAPSTVNASIERTGFVPLGIQSLEFKAWDWQPSSSILAVSFNGSSLSPVAIGTGANYTLYSADISAFDGQTGPLEFTAVFDNNGPSWIELDDISFSQTATSPEPSIVALSAIGGLLFGARKRIARR